jgi:hypothetical protein
VGGRLHSQKSRARFLWKLKREQRRAQPRPIADVGWLSQHPNCISADLTGNTRRGGKLRMIGAAGRFEWPLIEF